MTNTVESNEKLGSYDNIEYAKSQNISAKKQIRGPELCIKSNTIHWYSQLITGLALLHYFIKLVKICTYRA